MWEKKEFKKELLDEMLEMTKEHYGEKEHIANKLFVEHEYFNNPAGGPLIALAYDEENDVMAGQYVTISQKIKVNDKEYPVILSLNTLTREAYRGQKIFTKLAEDVYQQGTSDGKCFCYGAPNPNSHPGFVRKLGFVDLGIIPLYLAFINPIKAMLQLLGLIKVTNEEKKIKHSQVDLGNGIKEITEAQLPELNRFWECTKEKYSVMIKRDFDFFKWRYFDMPLRDYRIFGYFENGEIKGYLVTRVTTVAKMQCGMIVDFLFEGHRTDIGQALIQCVKKELKKQGASLMGCLMQRHAEEAIALKRNYFFICPKVLEPQPFPIIYKKLNSYLGDEVVENFSNWFFTMGDYDAI